MGIIYIRRPKRKKPKNSKRAAAAARRAAQQRRDRATLAGMTTQPKTIAKHDLCGGEQEYDRGRLWCKTCRIWTL